MTGPRHILFYGFARPTRAAKWVAVLLACAFAHPAVAAVVSIAHVPGGIHGTGRWIDGSPQASGGVDPHYVLVVLPAGCSGLPCQETATPGDLFGPSTYVVQGPNGAYPLVDGVWTVDNDANSQWIGPRADQTNPQTSGSPFPNAEIFASNFAPYVYRLLFNVSALGLTPETTEILLAWASDDTAGTADTSHVRLCAIESASDPACPEESRIDGSGNAGAANEALTPLWIRHGRAGAFFSTGLMALDFFVYNSPVAAGAPNPSGLRVEVFSAIASTPEPGALGAGLAACAAVAAVGRARAGFKPSR